MAVFKNVTQFPIMIIINGVRRQIKPGKIVHGPESLGAIVGLDMVDKTLKTIIPGKKTSETPSKKQEVDANNNPKPLTRTISHTKPLRDQLHDRLDAEYDFMKKFADKKEVPSVTIAILTKNSHKLISDCCNSIIKKVKYANVTILIADTGTTEKKVLNYYKEVEARCAKKRFKFKRVDLEKFHFSKNYNEVIRNHVDTDYVLIQNNDTVALNDYVTEMMQYVVFNKVASIGCRMLYPNNRIQHDGQHIYDPRGTLTNPGHLNINQLKENLPNKEHDVKLVDGNTAAGVLVETKMFLESGGFDEDYGDIFQDVDLMIKLPNMYYGKFNYCNRNAEITHIDNASRLKQPDSDTEALVKQMHKDSAVLRSKTTKNRWRRQSPEPKDVSIITVVNDLTVYKKLLDSIKEQIGSHNVEIIGIPNFNNLFTGCGKALNTAMDLASSPVCVCVHQDVTFSKEWLNNLKRNVNHFNSNNIKWGVIGPAGVTLDSQPVYYLLNKSGEKLQEHRVPYREVNCLDELCLVVNKASGLKFTDNVIDGFHFYGGDICVKARTKSLKVIACDLWCHHDSEDGKGNLDTEKKYRKFVKDAIQFHKWASDKRESHWRTTTAMGQGDKIVFFLTPPDYPGQVYVVGV